MTSEVYSKIDPTFIGKGKSQFPPLPSKRNLLSLCTKSVMESAYDEATKDEQYR
jgi:hypothetical protein